MDSIWSYTYSIGAAYTGFLFYTLASIKTVAAGILPATFVTASIGPLGSRTTLTGKKMLGTSYEDPTASK